MRICYTYYGAGIVTLMSTLALGCGHPSDAVLLARFREHTRDFEAIAAAASQDLRKGALPPDFILRHGVESEQTLQPALIQKYRMLLGRCCSKCDLFRDALSGTIMLTASTSGLPLKGSYKGYAYSPNPPAKVLPSLDAVNSVPDDCKFHFRPIAEYWYLYYQNCE